MANNEQSNKQKNSIEAPYPFKCATQVQLRFNDIDANGHLNNAVYFTLFDLAKTDYFDKVTHKSLNWNHVNIVIASIHCNFLQPTFFNEAVAVQSQVSRLGNKSFDLIQQLVNATTGQVKCIAKATIVYLDPMSRMPATIPQVWRNLIALYEGHDVAGAKQAQ